MKSSLDYSILMQALDWAYEKAGSGIPGMDSAKVMADQYLKMEGTLSEQINSLIRWQNTKAGVSGFVTGLGGLVVLPVTLPANLVSVLYVQIRMIAAIAIMCGYNLNDKRVKTLVFTCLTGNMAKDLLQQASIKIGTRVTVQVIERISEKSLVSINQRVGFRLLSTYGSKGALTLIKAVPIVGGVIGGAFDVFTTNAIGMLAKKIFYAEEQQ